MSAVTTGKMAGHRFAALRRQWLVEILRFLPQALLSRAWGWLARRRRPRLLIRLLIRTFVRRTGIDLSDAAQPIEAYATLEDLFVRRLKPGARPTDAGALSVVSPVDGLIGACGTVSQGMLVQVKGRAYALAELLDDAAEALRYRGGQFTTLYLSPRHYHRIHAPIAGDIRDATLVPGRLLPVFPAALTRIDKLFATNERLVTYIDSPQAGRVAVVKVGATLVGRISLSYDPTVWTNRAGQRTALRRRYEPPARVVKGGELAAFELGSTVVLVTERDRVLIDRLTEGDPVRVGSRIGVLRAGGQEPQG